MARFQGPLPENAFVADAKDSIPEATRRTTTATWGRSSATRARGRGRGMSGAPTEEAVASRGRGRGRGRSAAPTEEAEAIRGRGRGRGRSAASTKDPEASRDRGRSSGNAAKRKSSKRKAADNPTHEDQVEHHSTETETGYNTGPGSLYYLIFGDSQQQQSEIPDLNADLVPDLNAEELPLTQNAPTFDPR
jgi:hypothetical protein